MGSVPSRAQVKAVPLPASAGNDPPVDREENERAAASSEAHPEEQGDEGGRDREEAGRREDGGGEEEGGVEELRKRVAELNGLLCDCERRRREAEAEATTAQHEVAALRQTSLAPPPWAAGGGRGRGRSTAVAVGEQQPQHRGETAKAQEQLIKKFEEELASRKQEVKQISAKYERKLHKLRTSSAKLQAEAALAVFEHRQESNRLVEDNAKLIEQLHHIQAEKEALSRQVFTPTTFQGEHSSVSSTNMEPLVCGHLQLIRELTEQVSSLGSELQAANLTVDRLRGEADTTGRGSSAGSSACSRAWLSAGGGACTEEGRNWFQEPSDEI